MKTSRYPWIALALSGVLASPSTAAPERPMGQADSISSSHLPESAVDSRQVREWREGAVYRLVTAPGLVSEIALEPGEDLVSVAVGDTSRWVIGDTTSGAGTARRTHILVKPVSAGLTTNLVIATDRRVYHLMLSSRAGQEMTFIGWTYAKDQLLALGAARDPRTVAEISLDRVNFSYRIEGDRPPWRPVRAFDDGAQTFIEFPPGVRNSEIPPLFVIGSSGKAELTNYRLNGRYYVVDRLFSAAELRLGEKRQQVVRISRLDRVGLRGRAR